MMETGENRRRWINVERPIFTLFVGLVLVVALATAWEWSIRASIIILVLGAIGLALTAAQLTGDIKNVSSTEAAAALTLEAPAVEARSRWTTVEIWVWILGFYALILLIGFPAAVPIFVFAYAKFYGSGWILSSTLALASWGFLYSVFDRLLHVPWPDAFIQWPFL